MNNDRPIVVVGGGPAGVMAALRSSEICPGGVVLCERNASLARKLRLTGKGRCNVTNTAGIEDFCRHFGKSGIFLRNVFSRFFRDDLIAFFEERGCPLKAERQGRVFPSSDTSQSIVDVLCAALKRQVVDVALGRRVRALGYRGGRIEIYFEDASVIRAQRLIVATGGASYSRTGSTGDGFVWARDLGHTVEPLRGGLVPLETRGGIARQLQGLTLKNIVLRFACPTRLIRTPVGELMFTHFGISGPLVLDHSADIVAELAKGAVRAAIDLKPGLSLDELERKLQTELPRAAGTKFGNYAKGLLPQRLAGVLVQLAGIDPEKKCHQVTKPERRRLTETLKGMTFEIKRPRPLDEAMVTCGGVRLKEINPKTMESRVVPGIYFCGEVLDLAASSGGYNLQAAFSTGYVAGESAALSLNVG